MPYCSLAEIKALAATGAIVAEMGKALGPVATRLDCTLIEAKAEIAKLIADLDETKFDHEGEGRPYPPCDVYRITKPYYCDGSWDSVDWYVKLGVDRHKNHVWVQSCHPWLKGA